MPDEIRETQPPKGYKHTQKFGGTLTSEKEGKIIALANRPFKYIDEQLCNLISTGIDTKLKGAVDQKTNILDLGSGTDSLACKQVAEKYGKSVNVVGLDFFPQSAGKDNISIVQANMAELPFKDESFDFIFSYQALMFLEHDNDEAAVEEIHRVLKPGGYDVLDWDSVGYMNGDIKKNLTDLASQLGLIWRSTILEREDRRSQMVHVLFKPPVDQEFLGKFNEVHERFG